MARAIRKARKAAVSPREAVAKEAEELAKARFNHDLDGLQYITEVDGQLTVDVSKMLQELMQK